VGQIVHELRELAQTGNLIINMLPSSSFAAAAASAGRVSTFIRLHVL
jgi:hypothetical protein